MSESKLTITLEELSSSTKTKWTSMLMLRKSLLNSITWNFKTKNYLKTLN